MSNLEKPKAVEVGSRWARTMRPSVTFVVEKRHANDCGWEVRFDGYDRPWGDAYWFTDGQFLTQSTYLGPPGPPSTVMEARGSIPARCLICGGDKGARSFTCERCCTATDPEAWKQLVASWEGGARDFPRSPTAAPSDHPSLYCTDPTCMIHAPKPLTTDELIVPGSQRPITYRTAANELTDQPPFTHVGNLTALQAIQARKKPEPWIPTVDDWDLLPDAGR